MHQEACLHLDRTIAQIREAGLQTGVALNPATPVETLDVILPEVDMVLLMTVNPGFGGPEIYSIYGRKNQEAARNVQREGTFHPH